MNYKIYAPENLELGLIKQKYPSNLKDDHLRYVCHKLIKALTYTDEDKLKTNDWFAEISAKGLKNVIGDYCDCIYYLLEAGVIECDKSYKVGVWCKGYRFTDTYTGVKFVSMEISDPTLRRKLKNKTYTPRQQRAKRTRAYPHLRPWIESRGLKIDRAAAMEWIDNYIVEQEKALRAKYKTEEIVEKHVQRIKQTAEGYKIIVDEIYMGDLSWTVDNTGRRFHTVLTRLKKELRKFVTYKGQNLVAVDISCSQPYLSQVLLQETFWKSPKTGKPLSVDRIGGGLEGMDIKNLKYTIMLLISSKTFYSKEFQKSNYFDYITSGKLYEHIQVAFEAAGVYRYPDDSNEARNIVKKQVLHALYCDENQWHNRRPGSEFAAFKQKFPEVVEVFSLIKESNYKLLPGLLQRIESKLVLDVICKRISREKPELPIFTVHDSIVTIRGQEGYLEDVMKQELTKYVGYPPHLKIENWG